MRSAREHFLPERGDPATAQVWFSAGSLFSIQPFDLLRKYRAAAGREPGALLTQDLAVC
jgi:hypothetical protein